jgi:phospholipid/cholesterol/gamma-HCH transport system substrate-binding protein
MTMLERLRQPRLVGLVGVVGVLVLGLVVVGLSQASIGKRHLTAVIEHTAGLRVGEEVQVAGVGVGEVTSIELTADAVEVGFTIDSDIELGSTTSGAVKVATLLGTHFLEITPSGPGSLDDGTIPLARTSVPYNLQDVVDATQGQLEELDEQAVAESFEVVADVLGRTPEEALDATGAFTGLLVNQSDEILNLLEQSTLVLDALTSRQAAIDALLVDAQALADAVNGILADTADDLDPLMVNLSTSLQHLYDVRDTITATLTSLSTMTYYLANASGNGPWIDLHVPSAIPDNIKCLQPGSECS